MALKQRYVTHRMIDNIPPVIYVPDVDDECVDSDDGSGVLRWAIQCFSLLPFDHPS